MINQSRLVIVDASSLGSPGCLDYLACLACLATTGQPDGNSPKTSARPPRYRSPCPPISREWVTRPQRHLDLDVTPSSCSKPPMLPGLICSSARRLLTLLNL